MIDKILGFRESFVWKALRNLQRFLLTFTSCAMTLIICVVVFIRYFLHGDLFGYEEINIVLCMWFYFIGAAYSALDKKLISSDMTSLFLNPAQRRIVDLVVKALTAILSIVMAVWGYNYFVWGLGMGGVSSLLKIPLTVSQSAMFFGYLLIAFYSVIYFIEDLILLITKREPVRLETEDD